jgi:excisionase family DNA binding protein
MIEDDPNEIMTVSQVATYLHLAEKRVVRMAQWAEIPAAKVASQWRFMRSIVREWLAAQMRTLPVGRARLPWGASALRNKPQHSMDHK